MINQVRRTSHEIYTNDFLGNTPRLEGDFLEMLGPLTGTLIVGTPTSKNPLRVSSFFPIDRPKFTVHIFYY